MAGYEQGPTRKPSVLQGDDQASDVETIEVDMSDDEGIALALSMCAPGESISIHTRECACAVEPYKCTCTPTYLTAGARA